MERIIDASDLLLGRLCTRVAKIALLGQDDVHIVNCEKAVISGNKADIVEKYRHRRARTDPFKGPYPPRRADRIIKRTIRGMLPYKQYKGINAYKKIRCWEGIPAELVGKKTETFESASIKNTTITKFVTIKEIAAEMGR